MWQHFNWLTGQTVLAAHSAADRIQGVCTDIQMSTSRCANLSDWYVHIYVGICKSKLPPICGARQPRSTLFYRTTWYGQRSPTLWNSLPLTARDPSLFALLKTITFCRPYQTSSYRLRDNLGCKNWCANRNFLTHLLITRPSFQLCHRQILKDLHYAIVSQGRVDIVSTKLSMNRKVIST